VRGDVGHNNFLSVEKKISSPGLGYFSAKKLCLRLHRVVKNPKQLGFFIMVSVQQIELNDSLPHKVGFVNFDKSRRPFSCA
jgi:hypothetical protein